MHISYGLIDWHSTDNDIECIDQSKTPWTKYFKRNPMWRKMCGILWFILMNNAHYVPTCSLNTVSGQYKLLSDLLESMQDVKHLVFVCVFVCVFALLTHVTDT